MSLLERKLCTCQNWISPICRCDSASFALYSFAVYCNFCLWNSLGTFFTYYMVCKSVFMSVPQVYWNKTNISLLYMFTKLYFRGLSFKCDFVIMWRGQYMVRKTTFASAEWNFHKCMYILWTKYSLFNWLRILMEDFVHVWNKLHSDRVIKCIYFIFIYRILFKEQSIVLNLCCNCIDCMYCKWLCYTFLPKKKKKKNYLHFTMALLWINIMDWEA